MHSPSSDREFDEEKIARLISRYVSTALHRYRGNLASVVAAIENDYVPDERDDKVRAWMGQLSTAIAEAGLPQPDSFLLRYALTVPGFQRGVNPPIIALEENRGGFRPKRHRESAGQIQRLQEALGLASELGIQSLGDSQQAIQSLARMVGDHLNETDDKRFHWFASLDSDELDELARRAMKFLTSSIEPVRELGSEILKDIVCFRDDRPLSQDIHRELVRLECYWPSCLYRDATESITEILLEKIDEETERPNLSILLSAISWTRNEAALKAFAEWERTTPGWSDQLFVPPKDYLPYAGLSLNTEGKFESLVSETCFRVTIADDSGDESMDCRTEADMKCPACGGDLCWLFDFTQLSQAAHEKVFAGVFASAPLRILCCLFCGCYENNFSRFAPEGDAVWLSPQQRLEFEGSGEASPVARRLSLTATSPYAGSEPFALQDASSIGGMPSWVQDAEYPSCLECGDLMRFFAQHDNGAVGEEGLYFAFFCESCSVACVHYQQT